MRYGVMKQCSRACPTENKFNGAFNFLPSAECLFYLVCFPEVSLSIVLQMEHVLRDTLVQFLATF
jgi:hypothetical protein